VKATAKDSSFQRRNRQSIRLQGYDYSRFGAYYITICARDRQCLFGNVVDRHMQLNQAGLIICSVWDDLPRFYDGIELDAFVVMPNHVHGVVVINQPVGTIHDSPSHAVPVAQRCRMLLAKLIGRFKMVSAKQINALRGSSGQPLWQRNYYEHVIRDDGSLNRIRQYISDNPAQWEFDHENPVAFESERRGDS
jgi:putative transposase